MRKTILTILGVTLVSASSLHIAGATEHHHVWKGRRESLTPASSAFPAQFERRPAGSPRRAPRLRLSTMETYSLPYPKPTQSPR